MTEQTPIKDCDDCNGTGFYQPLMGLREKCRTCRGPEVIDEHWADKPVKEKATYAERVYVGGDVCLDPKAEGVVSIELPSDGVFRRMFVEALACDGLEVGVPILESDFFSEGITTDIGIVRVDTLVKMKYPIKIRFRNPLNQPVVVFVAIEIEKVET